jgi:hypothetical protein
LLAKKTSSTKKKRARAYSAQKRPSSSRGSLRNTAIIAPSENLYKKNYAKSESKPIRKPVAYIPNFKGTEIFLEVTNPPIRALIAPPNVQSPSNKY